jgi:hypothetical protein
MIVMILIYNFASSHGLIPWSLPILTLTILLSHDLHFVHWTVPTLPKQYLDPLLAHPPTTNATLGSHSSPPCLCIALQYWQCRQANTTIASERRVRLILLIPVMLELTPAAPLASHMPIMTLNLIRSSLATNRVVKGLAGLVTANVQVGTLVWTWENDEGVSTTFRIPNSY